MASHRVPLKFGRPKSAPDQASKVQKRGSKPFLLLWYATENRVPSISHSGVFSNLWRRFGESTRDGEEGAVLYEQESWHQRDALVESH